mgnify:CR=1 FL=1
MSSSLEGVKVLDLSRLAAGNMVSHMLADHGADVIKVERPNKGDDLRTWKVNNVSHWWHVYSRNKRSLSLNIKTKQGTEILKKLISTADVFIENFRPGAMDKLGFSYEEFSKLNSELIYCSAKGFLKGPYEHRTALDEVAQMMGGLAYMTGPPGRPLRAGSSVIDIMGGMFGAIAILAALQERQTTKKGQKVTSALYENVVYLMGQHMAQTATTGSPPPPMSVRVAAWAVYDIFDTKDGEQIFIGVVSDTQWKLFCESFGLDDYANDESLDLNKGRVEKRDVIIPRLQELFRTFTKNDLMKKLDSTGLPFAPISKPEDLFDDVHLNESGGLLDIEIPTGGKTKLPAMPINMDDRRFDVHTPVPKVGEHSIKILEELGMDEDEINDLFDQEVVSRD